MNHYVALRNYLIGPLFEEFYFRICMVPLLIGSNCGYYGLFFCSAFIFGAAHFHHIFYHIKNGAELNHALFGALFQVCYTSIFGIFEVYIYIRTGHFISIFLFHMLCNIIEFPSFDWTTPGDVGYNHRYCIYNIILFI